MNAVPSGPEFPRTRWTTVLRLREREEGVAGAKALAELCEMYWAPLYAFARRCGRSQEDAEDLTQGFFARLLERDLFDKADPDRGRLRSFLLGTFKNYMSDIARQARREKRGGGQVIIPLHDLESDEVHHASINRDPSQNAEHAFDRAWFDTLLDHALRQLESEYAAREKGELFARLQPFLAWNKKEAHLSDVARELSMTPGALRVAILRLRQRFRELIERQVAETVNTAAEAAEELQALRRVLSRN